MSIGMAMRRKKHHAHTEKSRIIGLLVASFLRSRLLHRTLISATATCLLLLFAVLSLLAPSPTQFQSNRQLRSRLESHRHSAFRVPASGGSCRLAAWSSMRSHLFSGCSNAGVNFTKANDKTHPDRYLLIATSGGLNQQRTGIIDAVVAAYILNATLVLPELDHTSFWKDTSNFSELFDPDWFITFLRNDVRIIKHLPTMGENFVAPYTLRVPRKCTPKCYEDRVLPVVVKKRASKPDKVRRHGRCPLTPEEVGLMLRGLGFGSDVDLYVASGEIYGGEETLAPLKALFPNFHSKETIATEEELAPFASFSSRMAALDFIVCDGSDVFVTNNNGNMAKILAGRRRYFGHKPTIRPNAKKLSLLFINKNNITWEEFASRVRTYQAGFMGEPNELRPGRGEFHENPSSCICQNSSESEVSYPQNQTRDNHEGRIENRIEEQFTEEQQWSELDYLDSKKQNMLQGTKTTDSLPLLMSMDQAELRDFFSN
ncbi:hypothetical protein Fmac_030394 [Flemingia macrophylla]|uniref:O-fucosyltransferase family protein n=1 Tax=Flemingia macrophylla TaxID=520843 RepID=A0ABD1KZK2_9FABA